MIPYYNTKGFVSKYCFAKILYYTKRLMIAQSKNPARNGIISARRVYLALFVSLYTVSVEVEQGQ